jgi:8-oxo-dGTP diphosphatase
MIKKDKKVLLLRRFNTGYQDGNYSVPAGHVDEGESVADALVREAKEEIGINVKKQDITLAHVMHRKSTDQSDERLDFFFICKKFKGEIKNLEPQKCDDLSWFGMNKLPRNTIPYIRQAIKNTVSQKLYSELNW